MGHMIDGLTFNTLRRGNLERLPEFRNQHGKITHIEDDGSGWSDAEWLEAVVGELGEYANLKKKERRGDIKGVAAQQAFADELADVVIYLDILAYRLGIDLGDAVMKKWNVTSKKIGSLLYLDAEDVHRDVVKKTL